MGENKSFDKMRWRYGDTNPVMAAVEIDTEIHIGDLLYLQRRADRAGHVKPASAFGRCDTTRATLNAFSSRFLGVALHRSRVGDSEGVRVATTGVFEFACATGNYEIGDFVVPAVDQEPEPRLANQEVQHARGGYAIGRVARRDAEAATILVAVESAIMCSGIRRPV